ncbi:MAG: hypothetical protein L3J28_08690 [Candidatus Polarisedimenticolaceae bacterium]|nr:hypothetical protein [Candidatus Polarisedimenticolaceae bacterium]
MESAHVDYLSKNYEQSIQKLNEAEELTEELETARVSEQLQAIMTGPTGLSYSGVPFERAFIHYYKAMNFIVQADTVTGFAREDALQGARIEARKVDRLLNSVQDEKGTYDDVKEGKESTFNSLMTLLRGLQGRTHDPDALVYREDAYMRYMEGVIYELNEEFDSARIAYQAAASLYEKGYAKQYGLGPNVTEMAWFDVIRIMRKAGGYEAEVETLTKSKLTEKMKAKLNQFGPDTAQLIVVNHIGFAPKRKEMDMRLQLDASTKELVLTPSILQPNLLSVAAGKNDIDPKARQEQLVWFNEMYSDRGLLNVISNFQNRGLYGAIQGLTEKRTSISSLWGLAEDIGLVSGLDMGGTNVQVPYYGLVAADFGGSQVWLDGKDAGSMVSAESVANIALQGQLLSASSDLQAALARELTKVAFCANTAKLVGEGWQAKLAEKLCIAGFSLVSGADTRNWSTLPHTIMVQRYPLEPGQHVIKIVTKTENGVGLYHQKEYQIELTKGQIKMLNNRAITTSGVPLTSI